MVPFLPLLAVAIVAFVAAEIVSRRALDRIPSVALEEFPEIDRALLAKFSSYDPELGWCPQPNRTKQKDTGDHLPGEEVGTVVTYSTDDYASRVCPARDRDPDADLTVSTYGDSYCFCREVNDDETFQHYLAERLDTHVANYGGGNYGLDQALMRLERQYDEDPTDYVLVVVTASSIARILSVWKHYQEFGNVLAAKPRYVLEDGDLERIPNPVQEKEDLLDMESKAGYLRANDYHYEGWFRDHHATAPYTPTLLGDRDHLRYAANEAAIEFEARTGRSIPGIDFDDRQTQLALELEQPRVRYHEELFDERADLFDALIERFVDLGAEKGFTPVFVMVQQLRYATYEAEHGPIYGDLLERLDERYEALETVDMARQLSTDDVHSLYVERGEGGHYSPETNRRIADVLTREVFADEPGVEVPAESDRTAGSGDSGRPDAGQTTGSTAASGADADAGSGAGAEPGE